MCRNIKTLYNFDPPASDEEIRDAALQFVRKISGYRKPTLANSPAFETAVSAIAADTQILLNALTTTADPKNRTSEIEKLRKRSAKRFGSHLI